MSLSFINSSDLSATSSTKNVTTKHSDIGSRVKELLLSIPPQQGVALNQVAKVLCDEFGLNLEKAYLRIQILFKGGKGLRGWCQHLVKMQHSKDGYVIIFNSQVGAAAANKKAEEVAVSEEDEEADKLVDIGIN